MKALLSKVLLANSEAELKIQKKNWTRKYPDFDRGTGKKKSERALAFSADRPLQELSDSLPFVLRNPRCQKNRFQRKRQFRLRHFLHFSLLSSQPPFSQLLLVIGSALAPRFLHTAKAKKSQADGGRQSMTELAVHLLLLREMNLTHLHVASL
jgi:hypothetical protein